MNPPIEPLAAPPPDGPSDAVLVTGGTGFLGSHLVEALLRRGRAVTMLSRRPQPGWQQRGVRVVTGHLHDPEVADRAVAGIGTVFHVAARVGVWGDYQEFHRDNVIGTQVLLAAARRAGTRRFVHTSTPSVVYHGGDLAGADESLPLTTSCPSPYPLTKAIAERHVLAANEGSFRTVALRPHLIWGVGDPHLVPRILARARAGRLRIVGDGRNRVDMVHVENAVAAQLLAEAALDRTPSQAAGRAYFITNGEPVVLWEWINSLLENVGIARVTRHVSLRAATRIGAVAEASWRLFRLRGEPPMTRFVAAELAKDHWFSIDAARRDLGYQPHLTMAQGTAELVAHLRTAASTASTG